MQEDIKILENLKEYLQMLIDNGIHKIQYNELWHDEKTVDCINALENLIKGYRELEEWKREEGCSIQEVYDLFIPKSKIKEKIEELETKLKVFEKDIRYCKDRVQARLMNDEIYVLRRCMDLLKELMEE